MYYATQFADGGRITTDSFIRAFNTRAEAEIYLRAAYSSAEWDPASIEIGAGHYGDCWIKTFDEPSAGVGWLAPFALEDCIVQRPGSHPGGRAWWITPAADVLVVTAAREIE